MNTKFSAIVLGIGATGLGAVRGLGREQVPTCLIAYGPNEISLKSRYPVHKIALIEGTSAEKKKNLFEQLDKLPGECAVLPTSDWFMSAFTEYQESNQFKFKSCMPAKTVVDALIDKADETRLLENVIILPKTVQQVPSVSSELLAQLDLPIIFKPRSHLHYTLGKKNVQVKSEAGLNKFYEEYGDRLVDVIAQEIIPGGDDTLWVCNCTFDFSSELVCAFVFRRLSLSPPHYGVTSYAISQSNPQIIDQVVKLGKHLNYVGTAMIEFKYDSRDGSYKYIELNPRLGLCNYFDTRCGVNNVFATYQLAISGKNVDLPTVTQTDGVVFASVFEDFYSRKQDGQGLFGIIALYLRDMFKSHVFIYFAWEDIRPGLDMAGRDIRKILKSLTRKLTG